MNSPTTGHQTRRLMKVHDFSHSQPAIYVEPHYLKKAAKIFSKNIDDLKVTIALNLLANIFNPNTKHYSEYINYDSFDLDYSSLKENYPEELNKYISKVASCFNVEFADAQKALGFYANSSSQKCISNTAVANKRCRVYLIEINNTQYVVATNQKKLASSKLGISLSRFNSDAAVYKSDHPDFQFAVRNINNTFRKSPDGHWISLDNATS